MRHRAEVCSAPCGPVHGRDRCRARPWRQRNGRVRAGVEVHAASADAGVSLSSSEPTAVEVPRPFLYQAVSAALTVIAPRRFLGNHRVPLPKPSRFMAFNRKPRFQLNPRAVCRATPSGVHFHRSTAASPGCRARWSVWSRNELVGVNLEDCGPSDAVPSSVSQQCIGGVDE